MIAAFISALLLSLLCGLMYNAWKYEVERIEAEEGGWHSRIPGTFSAEDRETIESFANVDKVVIHKQGDRGTEEAADIYFRSKKAVFSDTPHIAGQLGIPQERIVYNYELLAMYLIRDSGDTAPRLVLPLFVLITLAASFSLIIIIHNAFAVSMNAKIRQLGILSSIGAAPRQIRTCLLQEAAALCTLPVLAGNMLGIAGCAGLMRLTNVWLGSVVSGRHKTTFGYHPLVLMLTILATVITIGISAWLPARRLSRITPLEAIRGTGEWQLVRRRKPGMLSRLFGIEGELAGNALKAQKKALRTASLSFLFSFLAFALMQCFVCLSQISTRETYFERYQNVWDIMTTVKDTDADRFAETAAVRELDGVESAIVYQKAFAKRLLREEELSEEMQSFGGLAGAPADYVVQTDGGWLVNAPIVIMDDQSFLAYCEQIGIAPRLDGAVLFNQIRDVTNPDFRHPVFMPYLKGRTADERGDTAGESLADSGEDAVSVLQKSAGEETAYARIGVEIPVLAYTREVPALREEYATIDYYELVHFMPISLWKKIKGQIGGTEEDSYLCVRAKDGVTQEKLNAVQEEIARLLEKNYVIEQENRIRKYETNNRQIQGMTALFSGFCILLAIIGIGNVFSNTLGFVRQRQREFARYMSIGMTPRELRKMFRIEAMVLACRPVLLSLPVVAAAVGLMLRASYMEAGVFLAEAPFVPVSLFVLAILASVAAAYGLAWRKIRRIELAVVLKRIV